MIKIFRPLQLSFNHRVLEHNRKFYFTVSATLGVRLQTREAMLEFDYLKDAFECMGESVMPDPGMPKPRGEFLVSGSFFSPRKQEVTSGRVRVVAGEREKELSIFGARQWRHGIASAPGAFITLPVDYAHAFGGPGFKKNPDGIGYKDGLLPCVESPDQPVLSPIDRPEPAGLSALDPMCPQRTRFQGTYNKSYLKKYFPGYPEDFDWRYFLCAPKDQWYDGYFQGNEPFEIHNMHPDIPVIQGNLPGLYARCFLLHTLDGEEPEFAELPLNLDTVWFFPEKLLALLIWRGTTEVADEEAEQVSHVLAAYEDRGHTPRSYEYYRLALDRRLNSDDALLANLNTEDLVPPGAKCAMELLQEMALVDAGESAFSRNLAAKAQALKKKADEKIEESLRQADQHIADAEVADEAKAELRERLLKGSQSEPDADMAALNGELESILPGITAGDPKKIDLKTFSFDKLDRVTQAVDAFREKKEKQARARVKAQLEKLKEGLKDMPSTAGAKLEETLKLLEDLAAGKKPKTPLPRLRAEEIVGRLSVIGPQVSEALQHLEGLKTAGGDGETIERLEKQIADITGTRLREIADKVREAEKGFKETYRMGAHFMEEGLSPHKDPVETVAERLFEAIADGQDVSGGDWACIDLSGRNLEGVDLSGAFLEQVNFKGAILRSANLSGAILARAVLEDADLSGANLEGANVGAVQARRANFTDAILKSAKLSKGDFSDADFNRAVLEDSESLEVIVNGTNFNEAHMPGMKFIESGLKNTLFQKTDLGAAVFYDCDIRNVDFSGAILTRCAWADARLEDVRFDGADLTGACFAATDPDKAGMKNISFAGARLDRCCFRGIAMPGADLSGASMVNALFNSADLTGADLSVADARQAQFRKARLAGANLAGINLMEGSLAKADIANASLVDANLYAVDMLRAVIENTDFRGSNRDATVTEE
jgi:uncharacterized protein YjbI with pentapeptide repeats